MMTDLEPDLERCEAAPAAAPRYFLRSKVTGSGYKAAGVLPLACVDGEPFVLLGAELVRTGPGGRARAHMW